MATRPRPIIFRPALVAISALTVAVTTAACGGNPSGRAATPATTLLLQAEAAVRQVPIVQMKGSIVEKGKSGTDSLTVDATSVGKTGTSRGTLDLEGPGLGFTGFTHYVIVGSSTWVNGTAAFWKSYFGDQTPTVTRLEAKVFPRLVGHWIGLLRQSTGTMYKDALGLSEPSVFVTSTLSGVKGTLANAGNQTVNGVSGVQITSSTGSKILVAADGAPRPIELAATASTSGSFSLNLAVSYPTGVTIAAPTHFSLLSSVLAPKAHQ